MKKSSGILMPVFSLPSEYGVGDFGTGAYNFIDYLHLAGQKFWQILPLVQTGYGNSPYSSVCSTSINPYFISLDKLEKEGLLTKQEMLSSKYAGERVNYEFLYNVRYPLLRKAYERFNKQDEGFLAFIKSGKFSDYALFMSLKHKFDFADFINWPKEYKFREKSALSKFLKENKSEVLFWQFVQYKANSQWLELKAYANKKGVKVIGDMPLYVALDSVDVWANKKLYKLDQDFNVKKVAGVPPDYFCQDGQLWGNPVYDYSAHVKDGFKWWTNRLLDALSVYDYVRIDHFRGLDRYYEIPADATTAKEGEWVEVPSERLFTAIHKKVDKERIIAEDLGIIDDGVRELLKKTGYPGMKILSFAFDGHDDNLYLPQSLPYNSLCYTGTHDNDTLLGLIQNASDWDKSNLLNGVINSMEIMGLKHSITDDYTLCDAIIELGFKSKAKLFIIPMQDLLKKGSEYRVNEPSTVKEQNWSVRFCEQDFTIGGANRLKELTKKYGR